MAKRACLYVVLCLLVFAMSTMPTGSALAQQPTPTAEPTPPGFAMPVEPPRGWGAEQWGNLRGACLRMAQKIQEHQLQPPTPQELSTRELCLTYGSAYANPSPGNASSPLPPPAPLPSVLPTPLPTAAPEFPPQSSIGGSIVQTASAAAL